MKVPTIDPDEMLSSIDAAAYLGVTSERIYALRRQGRIGMMIGGFWVFSKAELDNYKATRKSGRPKGYKPPPRKPRKEKEG
jgi:hypothetical protein